MRISTAALHAQGLNHMLRNQAALGRTQNEMGLGTRIVSAKDDPGGWSRAAGLDQQLAQIERYRGNAAVAQHHLGLEENALASANTVLDRVRELTLQAANASQSAESRQAIANEIQAQVNTLLSLANSDNGEGRYLFAGSADAAAPFSLNALGATYSGDTNLRLVDVGPARGVQLGDSGARVFTGIATGNGTFDVAAATTNTGSVRLDSGKLVNAANWDGGSYTVSFNAGNYEVRDAANQLVDGAAYQSGTAIRFRGIEVVLSGTPANGDTLSIAPSQTQDVFATLQTLATLVGSYPANAAQGAQQQTALHGALQTLDAAMARISDVRATVGYRLNAVDDALAQADTLDVHAQSHLSDVRDVDYAEATTRLNLQLTALQAAQASYQRVQGMSLFDYLR